MDDPRRHDRHDDELETLTFQDLFQVVRRGLVPATAVVAAAAAYLVVTAPSLDPSAYHGSPMTMSRR